MQVDDRDIDKLILPLDTTTKGECGVCLQETDISCIFRVCKDCFIECINNDYRSILTGLDKPFGYIELIRFLNDNKLITSVFKKIYEQDYNELQDIMNQSIELVKRDSKPIINHIQLVTILSKFTENIPFNIKNFNEKIKTNKDKYESDLETAKSFIEIVDDWLKSDDEQLAKDYKLVWKLFDEISSYYLDTLPQLYEDSHAFGKCVKYLLTKTLKPHFVTREVVSKIDEETIVFGSVIAFISELYNRIHNHKKLDMDPNTWFKIQFQDLLINDYIKPIASKMNHLINNYTLNIGRCSCGNGVISKATSKCTTCDKLYCDKCLKEIDSSNHECKKEDLDTAKELFSNSKCCPKCGIFIERKSGCPTMFCTNCKSLFDYNTLKILHGNLHNPERQEFMEKEHIKDDRFNYTDRELEDSLTNIAAYLSAVNRGFFGNNQPVFAFKSILGLLSLINTSEMSNTLTIFSLLLEQHQYRLNKSTPGLFGFSSYDELIGLSLLLLHDVVDSQLMNDVYVLYSCLCKYDYKQCRDEARNILIERVVELEQHLTYIFNQGDLSTFQLLLYNFIGVTFQDLINTLKQKYSHIAVDMKAIVYSTLFLGLE